MFGLSYMQGWPSDIGLVTEVSKKFYQETSMTALPIVLKGTENTGITHLSTFLLPL
jgi:hypothetical protein